MTKPRFKRYCRGADGTYEYLSMSADNVPDWLAEAAEHLPDREAWERALGDLGANIIEQYGLGGEYLEVWRAADEDEFYIEHVGMHGVVSQIVVTDLVPFLHLQSAYIAPVACKIMQADQYHKWEEEMERERLCAMDS